MKNVFLLVFNVPWVKIRMSLKIFVLILIILLNNTNDELPICSIVTGDFNARCFVPTRIVLLNRIVHLNTVNHIVHNWTITSSKIQHSPDFQKPGCGKRTIWFDLYCHYKQFSTVFFKGWNSWIQFLFYFFLEHHLKTLNKEQYSLTHVYL